MTQRCPRPWFCQAPATATLLLAYIGLFVAMAAAQGGLGVGPRLAGFLALRPATLANFGALAPHAVVVDRQYWRLGAASLLHASLIHLAMNGWALYQLGRVVEEWFGGPCLLALHLVLGSVSHLAIALTPGLTGLAGSSGQAGMNRLHVGASGALFGLLAFLMVVGLHVRSRDGGWLFRQAAFWLIIGLLAGPALQLMGVPADNIVHLAGAVVGAGIGWFEFGLRPNLAPRGLSTVLVLVSLAGYTAVAWGGYRDWRDWPTPPAVRRPMKVRPATADPPAGQKTGVLRRIS